MANPFAGCGGTYSSVYVESLYVRSSNKQFPNRFVLGLSLSERCGAVGWGDSFLAGAPGCSVEHIRARV